ncbi:hypothetical protein DFH06DRAFT_1301165 [Mycena polygramma]|nr:hypothetical protein DFH06DRAFT_1301165 [Mycena polygramma]
MRALTSLPLDDDLIDRILGFCPEFDTLLAMLLTCKAIYSVFSARPRSITRAVAHNVAGPALTDAVRVLREKYPYEDRLCSLDQLLERSTLSAREKHELQTNANVVERFEKRGLYRMMRYSERFSPGYYYLERVPSREEEELERVQTERRDFLAVYPTPELMEMHAVVCFVTEKNWALSAGPAPIIEAFETKSYDPIQELFDVDIFQGDDDYLEYDEFFMNAFSRIWKERQVAPPVVGPSLWGCILDEIEPVLHAPSQ